MPKRREPWQNLRVGDRIRIVRMPYENNPEYWLHDETKDVYAKLIALRRVLRIYEIDKTNLPWVKFRLTDDSGGYHYHFLAVNDDSWELVSRTEE